MALSGKRNGDGFWNCEFFGEDDVDEDDHSNGFGKVFELCAKILCSTPFLPHFMAYIGVCGYEVLLASMDSTGGSLIFFLLEFLIPFLDAWSSILMDLFHLYTLHNGSHFSLVVCLLFIRILLDPFEEIFPEPRLVFGEM